ncbi:MAG: transglutaminase family protein [Acidimicrobiales bacterium]|nr:transglutaminase family protein [Acidimicrobiales bacterium]
MIYEIVHTTRYDYDAAVSASYGQLHQMPADLDGQVCLEATATIEPRADFLSERTDYFGNAAAVFTIHEPHSSLTVTSRSLVDCSGRDERFPEAAERVWTSHLATARPPGDIDAVEFVLDSPRVTRSQALADYAMVSFAADTDLASGLLDLNGRIHRDFEFDADATQTDTPLERVLDLRRGVCQDFAHVMIGCLRSIGLAAAYVSGYIETDPPAGQPKLVGADRTHAWVGVHLGSDAWIGIDPTNDQLAGGRYITTARGRDYGDVVPMRGVVFTEATRSDLTVTVDVRRTLA